jgi:hypothetical protein
MVSLSLAIITGSLALIGSKHGRPQIQLWTIPQQLVFIYLTAFAELFL